MPHTHRLKLPFIYSSQAQKEITHNEALNMLDVLIHPVVKAINVESPPEGTNIGDLYIIASEHEASGVFKDYPSQIAVKTEAHWQFITPPKWLRVTMDEDGSSYQFNGHSWVGVNNMQGIFAAGRGGVHQIPTMPATHAVPTMQAPQIPQIPPGYLIKQDTGEYLRGILLQEDVELIGGQVDTKIQIPSHSIVIAVNIRVIQAITGAAKFNVGAQGVANKYGHNLATALDTTNIGLVNHPTAYWQNTPIRLTPVGGNFTGGVVSVSIQLLKTRGPWDWE